MQWLERRANTECPCCRTPLVSDEEVWETVQKMRQERRRQVRKANRNRSLFSRIGRVRHSSSDHDDDDDTIDPTPPPSPVSLSPTTTNIREIDEEEDSVNDNVNNISRPDTPDLEVGHP